MARKSTRSVTINAPVETVFAFLVDPTHWMLAIPNTEVTDTKLTSQGVGTTARWAARILGTTMSVVHEYIEFVPNQRIVSKANSGFMLTFTVAAEDDGTRLTLDGEWAVHVPLVDAPLQAVAMAVMGDTPDEILTNLKAALESEADWRDTYATRQEKHREGPQFTRTVTIDAPVEKVFANTKDPELWMGAFPGRIEISDVKTTPEGVGTTFRFTETTFGMTSTGTHEYLEYVPDRRLVTKSSKGPVFTWTFEPVDGATTLRLHVVETGLSRAETTIESVFRTFFEGLMDTWLANLKAVLESDEDWRTVLNERRKHPKAFEYTRSITINAPVATVFAITKDPQKWMGTYPGMEVWDVKATPEGVGTTFRWAGKLLGVIPFTGTHECLEYIPDQRFVSKSSAGPVFAWTFKPVDAGTELTMHVSDAPHNRLEAAIDAAAAKLYQGADETWLNNIKAAIEAEA